MAACAENAVLRGRGQSVPRPACGGAMLKLLRLPCSPAAKRANGLRRGAGPCASRAGTAAPAHMPMLVGDGRVARPCTANPAGAGFLLLPRGATAARRQGPRCAPWRVLALDPAIRPRRFGCHAESPSVGFPPVF